MELDPYPPFVQEKLNNERLLIQASYLLTPIELPFSPARLPTQIDHSITNRLKETGHQIIHLPTADGMPYELFLTLYDQKDGEYRLLYPSGKSKMISFYRKGKLHGPSVYLSEEGALLHQCCYVDGKIEGPAITHSLGGQIVARRRFLHGELHSLQEFFYPNGRVKTVITYTYGVPSGTSELYNCQGKLYRSVVHQER